MRRIVTVTFNPAIDLTTSVKRLVSGPKLRCVQPRIDPGGGGINVSRAIAKLGFTSIAVAAIGGVSGEILKCLIDQEGVEAKWFEIDGDTRQSFTVQDESSSEQYRFVLPGPEWSSAAFVGLLETCSQLIKADDYVVASGSLPPGVPDDAYHQLAELADQAAADLIIDTSGPALAALVKKGQAGIRILVMDEDEASQLAGIPHVEIDDASKIGTRLIADRVAETIIVTLGGRAAVVTSPAGKLCLIPPNVQISSKVGAGDSFVAGLVTSLSEGRPFGQALKHAMGTATSAVTTPATELCTREGAETYSAAVECKWLGAL